MVRWSEQLRSVTSAWLGAVRRSVPIRLCTSLFKSERMFGVISPPRDLLLLMYLFTVGTVGVCSQILVSLSVSLAFLHQLLAPSTHSFNFEAQTLHVYLMLIPATSLGRSACSLVLSAALLVLAFAGDVQLPQHTCNSYRILLT